MLTVSAIVGWYLIGQLIAWVALPLAWRVFRWLPDRGYSLRPVLGLLLAGYTLWLGTAAGLSAGHRAGAWLALAVVLALNLWVGRKELRSGALGAWLRRHRRALLLQELLILVVFVGWCGVRMHDPAIDHTEEPMDLMLLSAIVASPTVPPQDPWLSGYAISYYYFGHWLQAVMALLAGRPPEVAYNLAQAWWLAITCSASFGIVSNLLLLGGRAAAERWRAPLGGILGALTVVAAANPHGTWRAWRVWLGDLEPEPWWWFRSTRVLVDRLPDGTETELITEFPAFSFILGDNHPHLLGLPVLLLAVALSLHGLLALRSWRSRGPAATAWGALHQAVRPSWTGWLVLTLTAGCAIAVNSWDAPAVWLLLALPACFAACTGAAVTASKTALVVRTTSTLLLFWLGLAASALLLFFPYLVTAQNQARGWLPNLLHPTPIGSWLLVFGGLSLPVLILIAGAGGRPSRRALLVTLTASLGVALTVLTLGGLWAAWSPSGQDWLEPRIVGGSWSTIVKQWLQGPFSLMAILLGLSVALTRLAADPRMAGGRGPWFALVLVALGFGLVALPELVYVHDLFVARINTVFKFYYQAWVLLALAAAFAIADSLDRSLARRGLAVLSLLLIVVSFAYPAAALRSKLEQGFRPPTLDGLAHLSADQRSAIEWVRRWTPPDAVILQAPGESYRPGESWLSAATGRPTLLGWQGHELQWRGQRYPEMAGGRLEAIEVVYRSGDRTAIERVLADYDIAYVLLGPSERQRYGVGPEREGVLAEVAEPVFGNPTLRIFRVR